MERFWLQRVSDDFCNGVYDCPDMDIELHETDCVVSTNAVLMDMARDGAPVGTVLWAHAQEGGRGRLGRSFSSPRGGVYISMLLPSPQDFNDIGFSLTTKTGVAVRRAIKDVCGADCGIKWVNDIVLGGRKVCGVLAQMVSRKPTSEDRCLFGGASDCVVMGIGVNYETPMSCFDEELRPIVGSLYDRDNEKDCAPIPPMRDFVFALIGHVYGLVCGCEVSPEVRSNGKNVPKWLDEYKSSSTILGNEVKVIQAGCVVGEGVATSIDDDCHLHVRLSNGDEMVLSTGEVSVRESSKRSL